MTLALRLLDSVGADQTTGHASADHARFMGATPQLLQARKKSPGLLGVDVDVRHALEAASSLLPLERRSVVQSFLQAPFTGSYTPQAGAVVGILKNMKATFESNLDSAIDRENTDAEAHAAFMSNLKVTEMEMKQAYNDKQGEMSQFDAELSARRLQASAAKESIKSAQAFLDELLPICQKKTEEYEARRQLRANEEAAISEAIDVLSADEAKIASFEPGIGGELQFLQLGAAARSHSIGLRLRPQKFLQQAMLKDSRLAKLVGMMHSSNPFPVGFKEISKILNLIDEEQDADDMKHAFCADQTDKGSRDLKDIRNTIDNLKDNLDRVEESVMKPETGLSAQKASLEEALIQNTAHQKAEISMRNEDKSQYHKNVEQMTKAEVLLKKAVQILTKFYSSLDDKSGVAEANRKFEAAFLQRKVLQSPSTWEGAYDGQSQAATAGHGAIAMLQYILTDIGEQLKWVQSEEQEAQHYFEETMLELKEQQRKGEKNLVGVKSMIAKAEQERVDMTHELKQANNDRDAIDKLLADIKPGCDFIFENYGLRTANRKREVTALQNAMQLLKTSPAYQAASIEAETVQPLLQPLRL